MHTHKRDHFTYVFCLTIDDLSFQIVYGSQVIAVRTSSASHKRQWMNQIQHYSALQQYK